MTTSMGASCAVNFGVGFFLLIVGLVVWRKQRVDLIHESHLEGVEDIRGYAHHMGKTLSGLGSFLVVIGAFCLFETFSETFISGIAFCGALVFVALLAYGQKKFSGSFLFR